MGRSCLVALFLGSLFGLAPTYAAPASPPRALRVAEVEQQLPRCAGGFAQKDIDAIVREKVDPRERFEGPRSGRHTMVEISAYQDCRARIWRLARTAASPTRDRDEASALSADGRKAANIGANAPADLGVDDYQGETTIAVHPTNANRLVAGANSWYRDGVCPAPAGANKTYGTQALYGSTDGGKTWVHHCAPWHPQVTGGVTNAVAYFGSDPALAFNANGDAYAVYMLISQNAADQSTSAIVVAKSTDTGASWTPHGVIVDTISDKLAFQDKELLAIDTTSGGTYSYPGRMYVIWDEAKITAAGFLQSQKERVAWSDDGVSWNIVPLSATGYHIGGQVVVGPDGTVYAAWNRWYPPDALGKALGDDTYWSKSTDGGQSWTPGVKILTHQLGSFQSFYKPAAQDRRGINSMISLDVQRNPSSPFFGRLHLAWTDVTTTCCPLNDFAQLDVFSSYSTDGGGTWSTRLKINDGGGKTALFPWIAVDQSDGTVSALWYDTRNDAANDGWTQVFTSRSSNGGVSWETNLQVTDNGSKFANGINQLNESTFLHANANPNEYGDYLGIVATGRKVIGLWTDSRNYYPTKPAGDARVEDASSAIITHCSPPSWLAVFGPPPPAPSATQPSAGAPVSIAWSNVTSWGVNGNGGSYTISRHSGANCLGIGTVILSNTSLLATTNAPAASGTYSYRINAKNKCPGTLLTPMSASACTNAVNYVKP